MYVFGPIRSSKQHYKSNSVDNMRHIRSVRSDIDRRRWSNGPRRSQVIRRSQVRIAGVTMTIIGVAPFRKVTIVSAES